MILDDLFQVQRFRPSVCHGKHIDAERILQSCLLVKHVGEVFHIRVALQLQDDTDSFLGGLVGDVHNVCGLFRLHERGHVVEELADIRSQHGIGDLRYHKLQPSAFQFLRLHSSPETDLPAACLIDFFQAVFIHHDPACGEIRSLEIAHQAPYADAVVFHVGFHGVDNFAQIMRGNAGSHTYRDAVRAVYQDIGDFYRKYGRLFLCLVEVGDKVHHIFIQVAQKDFLGQLLQAGLRISHGGRAVALDGTEIPVAVYKGLSFFEILGHYHKGFVNGTVAVGVVFTHGIAHDTGAFSIRPVISYPQLIHIIQRSSLNRLQSVPHIRKRSGNNNAHRIINIRFLHDL